MIMVGTVLGPGSIFIMLAGSLTVAFGVANSTAFIINLVPLIIFIIGELYDSFVRKRAHVK